VIQAGLVESAHDCSDGGIAVALAECSFSSYRRQAVGCEVNLEGDLSDAALLFSESPSRIIISATDAGAEKVIEIAREHGVAASVLGRTGGDGITIKANGETVINRRVAEVEAAWRDTLPRVLEVPSLLAAEEK
jgi:phosphoribosylformylglycinamidine (FGAM) synthase-like enzyme